MVSPPVSILFMFTGLSLGILTMQILNWLNDAIPYTVVIFILGVIMASFSGGNFGIWQKSVDDWSGFNAEMLYFVFLPPLVFGEAIFLNWFHVLGGFWQSVLLAGPGVLIGAILMAALTKVILPYAWCWEFCMVFGSILSATDPVAVVALLKNVGASPKLTILIVGESLANDGTAMVLFTLFFNMLNGQKYDWLAIIGFIANATFGSVGFGIVSGLFIVRWMRTATRRFKEVDTTTQITVTICGGYLIFFFAQYCFGQSGVLACCAAGLMLAWLAPPVVLNPEAMRKVWGMVEWFGNTLIFLIAGLKFGGIALKETVLLDWAYMVILYLVLMAIRVFIVFSFYPILSNIGHKCTPKETIFISWAGLRGALSISLAIITESTSNPETTKQNGSRLFFYVGGIAALTLIINATFAKFVLHKLKLIGDDSFEKLIMTNQIRKRLTGKMNKFANELETSNNLNISESEHIRSSCSLLKEFSSLTRDRSTTLKPHLSSHDISVNHEAKNRELSIQGYSGPSRKSIESLFSVLQNNERDDYGYSRVNSTGHLLDEDNSKVLNENTSHHDSRHRWKSRILSLQRQLSVSINSNEDEETEKPERIIRDLLNYHRTVLLEIVRVKYWKDIESGKLSRNSFTSRFLLYSVDVALDKARKSSEMQDWKCIEQELDRNPTLVFVLFYLGKMTSSSSILNLLYHYEARWEKRAVYLLTSFIEAHEEAQKKLHAYGGVNEDDNLDQPITAEEARVKQESIEAVIKAKERLNNMDPKTLTAIKLKQCSRMLLSKQGFLIDDMVKEGLMSYESAEEFFDEMESDVLKIEKDRRLMYKDHEIDLVRRMTSQVTDQTKVADLYESYSFNRGSMSQRSAMQSSGIHNLLYSTGGSIYSGLPSMNQREGDSNLSNIRPLLGSKGVNEE